MKDLIGLVLGGGKSLRMKRDKSVLRIGERSLAEIQKGNIENFVEKVLFSGPDHLSSGIETIPDLVPDLGPLGGIYSSMKRHTGHSFLVLPVDVYFKDPEIISKLLFNRDPECSGTVFYNLDRKKPEPLMGIYEHTCFEALQRCIEIEELSAMTFVEEQRFHWVKVEPDWININTPEDLESIHPHRP